MNKKNLIAFILILAIFFNFTRSFHLFDLKKITKNVFNLKYYENKYNQSQWIIPNSKNSVGDDVVYAYAGARYILGTNPILIMAEHPPLGKNLIGLSAIYLKNEYYFSLLSGLLALLTFFLLTNQVLKNKLLSFLLTLFLSTESLFVANFFSTNPDLLVFAFLNLYFYFLIDYFQNKKLKSIVFANIFLGLIISTKFFAISFPVIFSTILFFLIIKDLKAFLIYFFSLSLSFLILIVNYFQFFSQGKNLIDFLKLQKYIYLFHTLGRKNDIFLTPSLLTLIFQGRFHIGGGQFKNENHFSIFWPTSFLIFLIFIIKTFFEKKLRNEKTLIIILWVAVYSFFQSLTYTNARYLIPLLPYLYLLSTYFLIKLINDRSYHHHPRQQRRKKYSGLHKLR
jgi:hypothetical protein